MKHKLTVGQTVWLQKNDRHNISFTEQKVSKVGKKYFELENTQRTRYSLETLLQDTDYGYKGQIYLTKEEREEETEIKNTYDKIRRTYFQDYGHNIQLNLDQLRQIAKILNL